MRRLIVSALFSLSACAQSIPVLSQSQIQQLENRIAQNGGDPQSQTLLGQNYAFVILGITLLGQNNIVAAVDPSKATGDFAQHVRDAIEDSTFAGVLGEGGESLWNFSFQVQDFLTRHQSEQQVPYLDGRALGVQVLNHAIVLDPANQTWRSYRIPILILRSEIAFMPLSAADAYRQAKQDLSVLQGLLRYYALSGAAKLAVRAWVLDDAQAYAEELLSDATDPGDDWNYGNAIYFGNMVLGQVALRQGDLNSARSYLFASGNTPGSAALDSFGPNMSLALDFLQGPPESAPHRPRRSAQGYADSQQTVLDFFNQCQSFWKPLPDLLRLWSDQVKAGMIPDFGANLFY